MPFRALIAGMFFVYGCLAQVPPVPAAGAPAGAAALGGNRDQSGDNLMRKLSDAQWFSRMGDIADVDQIEYASLGPAKQRNPTGLGAKNPLIISAFTFIPKKLDRSTKHPLLVLPHDGVHSNFSVGRYLHIVREMVALGYTVIAPDYRGSTGYGAGFYNQIDYGGRENDDVLAAKDWALENYAFLDPKRVGIVGWSHGGMITLMNILQHPGAYAAAYAGVPVTDLVLRLGYHDAAYQAIFSDPTHIGKTVQEDLQEYLKRSPIAYADKLDTPLLMHTTTNDEDVNVIEVKAMITALKAAGKKFDYKIYEDAPGGHYFNRLDNKLSHESRKEIYDFLGRILKP